MDAKEPLRVVVFGLEGEILQNVEAALAPPAGLIRNGQVDRRWLNHFVRQVPDKAAKAMEPYGYYSPQISAETAGNGDGEVLNVQVVPGKPVRVDSVDLVLEGPGANDRRLKEILGRFPVRQGDPLRHDFYEEGKGALKARAIDSGYLQAEYRIHEILVDPTRYSAKVRLVLETGPLTYFGLVFFEGAPNFPERFFHRYLAFKPGDVFSYEKLGQTQLNFLDSDRFREVVITPGLEAAVDQRVPVNIQLTPSARRRLRPGIGYGTDSGARFTLKYKDVNSLHLGHELSADLMIAEYKQFLTSSYTIPSYRNKEAHTVLRLGIDREDIDTYTSRSIFAEGERVYAMGRGRLCSFFVRLLQEDYTIGGEDARSRMVIPGLRYSARRYDDSIRPRKGFHLRAEVRGAHDSLGSDTSLLQGWVRANVLRPLPFRLSLIARVEGAATWQRDPFEEIPTSLRFFAGGDNSIRGYRYQSLGPVDSQGEVVGGKHLLVGSLELERALFENWGVAVFYDAGNAYDTLTDITWAQGVGIGLRRYTLVGPVRLDVARQVGVDNPGYRFHISLGIGW
ncbi:outer membrane protein assembly factor [Desulfuromonas sp. AOP6]|nr:outer membrane protein assembly factor [Desulfuromonas sp. AOP6]